MPQPPRRRALTESDSCCGIFLASKRSESIGPELLKVQFFEVKEGSRLHGLGTEIMAMIASATPGRRLVAFPSEETEAFWEDHLKWDRYDDPENRLRTPLLVSPNLG